MSEAPSSPPNGGSGPARLLALAGRLKRLKRTGWLDRGVPPERGESVADHVYRTALLAWLAAAADPALDHDRVLKLALIHDLAEAITGDPAPYGPDELPPASDREARRAFFSVRHLRTPEGTAVKRDAERAAIGELLAPLPASLRDELHTLWDEYEAQESPESRFVKEADRLEAYLQSREYLNDDPELPVWGFADMAAKEVHHPALTAIRDAFQAGIDEVSGPTIPKVNHRRLTQRNREVEEWIERNMHLTILPHARRRMAERDISEKEVRVTLEVPDVEYVGNHGRIVAERTPPGRRLTIRVVYNLGHERERIVVTVERGRSARGK